jgi:hypothetical protein
MTSSQLSKIKQLREIDRSQPQLLAPVRTPHRYHLRYQIRLQYKKIIECTSARGKLRYAPEAFPR